MVQPTTLYQKMRNEPNISFAINKTLQERTQMVMANRGQTRLGRRFQRETAIASGTELEIIND